MLPSASSVRRTAEMLGSPQTIAALRRVVTLLTAYVGTALGVVGTIYLVRAHTDTTTLAAVIAALFMIQLTAGLEPGTVRALLLGKESPADIDIHLILRTSIAKALIASPAVFAIWWFIWTDVSSPVGLAAIAPVLTTIGFITSETRSLYEARGRYARGIWSKQGSVLVGIVLTAVVCLAGGSVMLAIILSQAGRIVYLVPFLVDLSGGSRPAAVMGRSFVTLLRQRHWQPLAGISILSAVSGSLDRLVVLRFLSPDDGATYIVLFEFLSKYWLLSYVLAPIMFAKRASDNEPDPFRTWTSRALLAGGVAFVAGVCLAPAVIPVIVTKILGAAVRIDIVLPIALAIAVNAFCQLLTADLQGKGLAHRVIILQAALLAGSIPLFFGLGLMCGLQGIGIAWLVRASVEYILLRWLEHHFDTSCPRA